MSPKSYPIWSLVVACLILLSPVFAADTSKRSFNLPADTAEKSLKRFSEQSGRSVMFATDTVQDIRTNLVQGEFSVPEALNRLLAGTLLHAIPEPQTGGFAVARITPNSKGDNRPNDQRAAQAPISDRPDRQNGTTAKLPTDE